MSVDEKPVTTAPTVSPSTSLAQLMRERADKTAYAAITPKSGEIVKACAEIPDGAVMVVFEQHYGTGADKGLRFVRLEGREGTDKLFVTSNTFAGTPQPEQSRTGIHQPGSGRGVTAPAPLPPTVHKTVKFVMWTEGEMLVFKNLTNILTTFPPYRCPAHGWERTNGIRVSCRCQLFPNLASTESK